MSSFLVKAIMVCVGLALLALSWWRAARIVRMSSAKAALPFYVDLSGGKTARNDSPLMFWLITIKGVALWLLPATLGLVLVVVPLLADEQP